MAWLSYLGSFGYYCPTRTERIFVIASQSDRVHASFQNELLRLAKDLATPAFKFVQISSGLKVETLCAAAVVSTVSVNDNVIQYTRNSPKGDEDVELAMKPLPDDFPENWKRGDFKFPVCQPQMPSNKTRPSKQRGLDLLTDRLLS